MPSQVGSTTTDPEFRKLSNDVEDFVQGGIGPDQADVSVVFTYASFDYAGKMANDPVLAVKGTCTPLDGSNESKPFDIEWTCGGKMSEVRIINDGGDVESKTKDNLAKGSNWALFQSALNDAAGGNFTKIVNGPKGIRELDGIQVTIKRVKQPERQGAGFTDKNEKGYDRTYYTCLKVLQAPGESKPGRKAASKTAAVATTVSTAKSPSAPSNGTSKLKEVYEYVAAVLDEASPSGSISLTGPDGLAKAVYKLVKAEGGTSGEANSMGTQASSEDYLIDQSMEHDFGWKIENGTLSRA
jgi:hypothetical protein